MRTLIDIPEQQIEELRSLCQRDGISRAELIRRAIAEYISQYRAKGNDAFGLWQQTGQEIEDGLEYQQQMRNEW